MTPAILLNIPEEMLIHNYLKYDIQIIFYPFYLLQNILLSSKFTIRDNFIYPNGKKYYISTGLFLLVLFIVYAYQVVNVNKMEIAQLFGFHNKTLIFLLYFYSVYNCFGIIVIFILNIVHSHNNVLLILTIQTIQDNVNMVKNHKNFIIWNWIYNLGLMCIGMLLIVLFGIAFGYWEFTGFCVDFLFLIYDLNLIYAIRIIILLKKYLMKFKKNILVVDHLQGKDHEKVFSVYKKFMKAYNLYKKIFHALIFLHCADAFTRCLGNIQLQLEVFELKSKHLSYMLTMGGTVFFLVKNVSLGALICVHCDKFYVAIEEVETACILQLMDVHCPDSNRRLYKNMIQLNRKSFSKISACGLFNVDAALLLTLIFLHCADTVCRFLGYLQMQFELYKLQRLQFLQSCNLKNIDDTMALTATIFMEVKNFTLVILLSVHCEKFYITIEDIETVCIQRLIDVHCSDDRRKRLYKSLIQLNRDSFSKISACGLFNIDASLPLSLNLLLTNYIVVLLQFAANPPQRVSYTNCTTASYYTTLFPHYFYSFLQSYMLIFSAQPILPPDEKILRIHQDIKNIIKIFTQPSDAKNYQDLVEETTEHHSVDNIDKIKDNFKVLNINTTDFGDDDDKRPETKDMGPDSEGLILITSLVTSCIRGLHHCTSKLYSLEILQLLCENSSSETILDRILPYIIHLSQDSVPRVRARAVATCARAVSLVQNLPNADCNVFPEYILPELAARATDPSVPVRQAYANNIAKLAETAVRFLDQTQNMVDKEAANINYETELSALHEMVRSTVSYLLTDSQAVVKRALVENGITKLCIFFGKQKANDVILSHMVTFLNDKEEAALRGCFFERVVGVAAYVGYHAAPILVPLLQQGLTDQSEWIIAKALRATTNLAELGLLPKQALCDLVAESAVFLAHPNLWIRHEVCGLVSCVASLMNKVDVHCKILPLVWPHLKHKLMQVERAELLLESLAEPIPRKVLDAVLRHGDVDRLVHTLRERRNTRLKVKQGTMPQYSEMGQQLRNLFRRLASDGMTEHVENQLLAMSAHLIKIQGSSTQHITEAPGRLVLQQSGISRAVPLDTGVTETLPHLDKLYTSGQNRRTHKTSVSHETHMNTEWQHMFGHSHDQHSRGNAYSVSEGGSASVAASGVTSQAMSVPPQHSQMGHSASYVQYSMAPCRVELRDLTSRMQQKYQKSLRGHNNPTECNEDTLPPAGWRPGNQLLAYLHEHKARVNQLVTLPAQRSLFGSCSDDGTVRLWDASKLQGHAHINRSKSTYNRNAGPVVSLAACEGGQSLVGATQESIFVLRTDSGSSRLSLSQGRQLESDGDEATCVAAPAQHSLIAYATLMASLVGWDLRAPGNAWKLQGDLKQGLYTCLYADPSGYLAAGTSSGAICVWDLRFLLPITSIRHPNSERVRRIISSGVGGGVWAAGERDASAWSLESTQRTTALWPCTNSVQPLHYASPASQYISSVYCGAREGNRFVVTGGSDLRLRYWDLDHPEDSYVLVHAPNDQLKYSPSPKYRSRIIDGTTVIQECCKLNPSPPASLIEDNVYRSVESRSFYHTAPITDLALVEGSKPYLVSSAADGVINVWK